MLFIMLALCNGALSMTISKAVILRGARDWVSRRSGWLGELVSCTYCVTHWASLVSVLVWQPRATHCAFAALDYAVSWFALVALSALVAGAIHRLNSSPVIRIG